MWLGDKWNSDPRVKAVYHQFEIVIAVAIVAAGAFFLWHRLRDIRKAR
jgi:hypothetical protein